MTGDLFGPGFAETMIRAYQSLVESAARPTERIQALPPFATVGDLVTPTDVLVLDHSTSPGVSNLVDGPLLMMYCQPVGDGLYETLEDERVSDIRKFVEVLEDAIRSRPDTESRFPAQPPSGSVLRFEQTHYQRTYTYVALRVNDSWYLTGRQTTPIGWPELVEKIDANTCHLVTGYAEIPKPPTNPVDEIGDPAEWFRSVYGSDGE